MKRPRTPGIMEWAGAGPYRWLLGAVMAFPLLAVPAGAQRPTAQAGVELPAKAMRQIEELLAAKEQRTPAQRKVISQLLDAAGSTQSPRAPGTASTDELVTVDIRTDVTPAVLARIQSLGGTVLNSLPKYRAIRAHLPLSAVEPLAAHDTIQSIRTADEAVTRKEDTSEGDAAHRAEVARQTYSVDGTGIGIGVLSDGVDTLATRQASGDLPDRVTVLPGQAGSGNEGTAMLEIVHDLAPGAELYFATAFGGQARFAANIEALCEAGADVIVDDVYYVQEAAFQDDLIAQGVNAAVAAGCVFVSAGGNGGNRTDGTAGVWEGDYGEGATLLVNGEPVGVLHDFGGGVDKNRITEDSQLGYVLQWADPLGASANDYDLFLVDADDNVIGSSTGVQDGTQDPIELISSSVEDHTDARLLIVQTGGAEDRYLRLDTLEGRLAEATEGNLFGHSAAKNAVSVAAVDARAAAGTGGVFNGTESVRTSNSDGPRRIFFEPDGTAITADDFSSTGGELLQKPDIAAATCVSTSTPGFSPFCGVSSAAPHAAAIAALMLEAAGGPGEVNLAALRTAMTGAALDIEATGVDRDSGAGIVMAPGAVDAVDVAAADRNEAPTVSGTLAVRTMAPGDAAVMIDVASAFDDSDDTTLTYTALSGDPDRVEVTVAGSMLTLTPKAPEIVTVAVRAVDPHGLSVTSTFSVTIAAGTRDYDADDDGLIDVAMLAQLDAMRYDLNGDGIVDAASDWQSYHAVSAFAQGAIDMGCPDGCAGYELTANLDFDTNGSGGPNAGDDYWNDGDGWAPIGGDGTLAIGTQLLLRNPFNAVFEGNGHTVSNLYIDTDTIVLAGLFGYAAADIRNAGLIDVDVTGTELAAGLAGFHLGEISASYVTGRVSGVENVGGMVGINHSLGAIRGSYATASVSGDDDVGGLVGDNRGEITAAYATGGVSGESGVGGLVGNNKSTGEITAAYVAGPVSGDSNAGGLVGRDEGGTVASSYWDTSTSGRTTSALGAARTTAQLQAPRGYSGIYSTWNVDLDGDSMNDDPWDFGTSSQYPVLSVDFDGNDSATWREFGRQLREGPALVATAGATQIVLAWMPVETNHWTPAPSVTYSLTRDDGANLETLGEGLSGLTFTDTDVTAGVTYTYQVAGVVQGGEAAQSALVEAKTTALPNMWLSPAASDPVVSARSEAIYTVTFQGAWDITVTPGGVPSGAHFTTPIGGVHNAGVAFLRAGGMATAGVESMAELGGTSTLANEVRAAAPNALSVLQGSGGNIGATGSSTIDMVTLTTDHPRVTLLSMVAPSPDWFVGVSGLSLLDAQGDWPPSQTLNLYPWDAGTEEGTEFSLSNAATSPRETIASLRGIGKFSNERIATLTFTRQSVNTAPSFSSDPGFEADENQTAAGRVSASDPDRGDGVAYALTGGADASKFDIGETTGVLTFQVPPNYERAADTASTDPPNDAGNNEYIVTVTATGGTGDRAMTTEQTIAVTVRNVEEAGTVSFSQGGNAITAALNDPDGGVNGAAWQWARSSNRNTGWTDIGSATSARYTPSSGDEEMYLRATVSYDDAQGSGKQARGVSASQIAPPDLRAATFVSGLSIPWDIAFTPDGTMLFTQRAGVLSSRLADGTVQTIDADFGDLFASGETGLMGIVVDPRFASNRRFYTCQGHTGPEIQVIAWTLNAADTEATRVADPLIGAMPATSGRHGGCRLRFGPESYLWIATGDAASGTVPQDLTSLGGKVLRVDASTGAGAPANPFAPSRIYTYGHRNVQGLALRPGTSQMWSVEHGPTVDDEINLLVAGRNYGWDPGIVYDQNVPMTDLVEYPDAVEAQWSSGSPTLATSGAIFLEGDQWGVWEGRLAVATLEDSKLRLFEFTSDGAFVSQVVVAELDGTFGRLRTPMPGPDGALYVTTSNGGGSDRILRLAENDPLPVTLKLTQSSIGENGGVSTVTASQNRVSIAPTTVTVSAVAVDPAISNDFILSANRTLTIPAGQTGSTGTVTITANNNDVDAPNKTVTVSGAAENVEGVAGPAAVTLTIVDDDAAPAVTLWLTPGSIGENRGVSTVTAALDRASSEVTTVTVSAMAVAPAVSDDFMLSTNETLTIAAGRTDSDGAVTVRAVDNNVDATTKEVRVSAAADNSQGVAGNPSPVTLRIADDDDAPELTLEVSPSAIVEDGGVSRVTVESVNGVAFAEDQEIRLSLAGTAEKDTDYTVGLERLTLAAGESSVATTVTAVDDALDDDAETILVTARHGGGVLGAERTITIADDDDAPVITTASLILVAENETAVATLAARDADRPVEDLTWRITGGADRSRFALTADGELTFRVAQDYEAPGDSDGNGDYEVAAEVSDGANPVEAVFTVRLQDVDDTAPVLSSASANGAALTLAYGEALDGSSRPEAGDFTVSGGDSARTVSNVAVSGRAVTLTLNPAVAHGETGIRVSYRPGTNPIRDAAGNGAARLGNEPVTNNTGDTTAPAVSRVEITSRPERHATYAAGQEIAVTVTFSETVVVTGTPRLRLNVGGIDRTANYRSGTGAALRFAYEVADGESDAAGVSIEADSVTGTIRDGADNDAVLTHDGLAADAGHMVDGVKPVLAVTGGAVVNGTTLTLTYGETLDGSSTPVALAFTVNVAGSGRAVSRVAVSGSAVTLTLDPPVTPGQTVRIAYRTPGANPIQDIAGNDARPLTSRAVENNTLDTTAPRVSRVAIASNPGPDGTYAEGDVMEVTVTFSETVQVDTTNGTPALALRVGRPTKPATYDRGSNSDRLVFSYMVTDSDLDTDGVSIAAGRIALNRGTIADLADNPAILAYETVPPQPGHAVDGVRPGLEGATVSGDTLTLTYNEALDEDSTPAADDFTVEVAGAERRLVEVLVNGSTVTLTLVSEVTPGETVTVSYTAGTRPIRDAAGNPADDLTEYKVGTPPPIVITPPPRPPTTGGGGGGGGGGRGRPPSYPGTMRAEGGDGEVTLTWDAPSSRGSSRIEHYEYRIDGEGEWISTGSTHRTHTITGLIAGRVYFFHLRAVSAAGPGAHRISPEATPVADLDFTHFANGGFITSTLALVNAGAYPVRPAIYFYNRDGGPIAARRVVDLTPDLEVGDDGALRPRAVMHPLEELTISTHGRGGLRAGSVTVRAPGSIGGVLRFDIPGHGVAGVGDSPTLRDALVPVRRQEMGINTGVAVRNRGTATLKVECRLMRDGAVLEETIIPLAVNGQDSRFIDQVFPAADTSDFAGSVRCTAPEPGRFSAVAFELDGVHRIFTTLPVVPVPAVLEQEQEDEQEQEEEPEQDATRLDFTHFANGGKIVSSLVLLNAGADPVRPAIYFHDQDGGPIAAESMVDITGDLEVGDDGALRPGTAIDPLGELTISTHGRGTLKVGSVAVTADGPIGGVLRFDIPRLGVAGVGDSPPLRDALVPVRRQDGGINTGVAVHNRGAARLLVRCRLMRAGAVLEETMIPLAANGQDSRFIDQVFPTADTSDFTGSVRCMTPEPGRFSAVAFELDGIDRIFTTLPVVPVVDVP